MVSKIIINSIDEYINIISKKISDCVTSKVKISSNLYRLFFRGQSNSNWSLEPSINRSQKCEKTQIDKYYKEYKNNNLFQTLARIQHGESGTRFLDFTKNPLVALYFACNNHFENDGMVYVLFFDGLNSDWNMSKILYYFTEISTNKTELTVEDYKKYLINKDEKFYKIKYDLNSYIINSVLYGNLIIPTKDDYSINKRLSRQCGVFYVCPPQILHIGNREKEHIQNGVLWDSDNDLRFSRIKVESPKWLMKRSIEEIIISKTCKRTILEKLDKIYGINKEYLFPKL